MEGSKERFSRMYSRQSVVEDALGRRLDDEYVCRGCGREEVVMRVRLMAQDQNRKYSQVLWRLPIGKYEWRWPCSVLSERRISAGWV